MSHVHIFYVTEKLMEITNTTTRDLTNQTTFSNALVDKLLAKLASQLLWNTVHIATSVYTVNMTNV